MHTAVGRGQHRALGPVVQPGQPRHPPHGERVCEPEDDGGDEHARGEQGPQQENEHREDHEQDEGDDQPPVRTRSIGRVQVDGDGPTHGRVGRGEGDSYCILQADDAVPDRLKAFAATSDGFKVAELDLEERGMLDRTQFIVITHNRKTMEIANRLYGVMNKRLADRPYLAGEYSIADMALYPWYAGLFGGTTYGGAAEFLSLHEYANIHRWIDEISRRPGTRRGMVVNDPLMQRLADTAGIEWQLMWKTLPKRAWAVSIKSRSAWW